MQSAYFLFTFWTQGSARALSPKLKARGSRLPKGSAHRPDDRRATTAAASHTHVYSLTCTHTHRGWGQLRNSYLLRERKSEHAGRDSTKVFYLIYLSCYFTKRERGRGCAEMSDLSSDCTLGIRRAPRVLGPGVGGSHPAPRRKGLGVITPAHEVMGAHWNGHIPNANLFSVCYGKRSSA